MSTVQVSLDINAVPPVTCHPKQTPVNRGNEEINWVPAQNQTFAFQSLTIQDNPPCFGTPDVTAQEISVSDENDATSGPYPYTIVVTYNGQSYSSAGAGIGGNPGDPTIQNK